MRNDTLRVRVDWRTAGMHLPGLTGLLRKYAYPILVCALTALMVKLLSGACGSSEPAFAPMGGALFIGALLMLRLKTGEAGTSLLLLPAIAVEVRFGAAALPALALASMAGTLLRGVRGPAILLAVSHDVLAFATAHLLAQSLQPSVIPSPVVFALVFVAARTALWHLGSRCSRAQHPRADRPDPLMLLTLAPLAAAPLFASVRFGDIGLVVGLGALLAILSVVVEARNLATARAEVEEERDRLARANTLQRDLFHLITHELKNPLTSVLAYSQLIDRALRNGVLDRAPAYVQRIEEGAQSIHRLVDNLLGLSQLEDSGELPPSEPVDLGVLAGTVAYDLEPLAERKHQQLLIQISESISPALAPPLLLQDALSNLVSNAIKYTPEGGTVKIWARPAECTGAVELGVTDTGIGLSTTDLAQLFTKFFRSDDPRARDVRGSGLGLALTHAVVTRMGGRIDVESQLHQGSTFRLVLPTALSSTGGSRA